MDYDHINAKFRELRKKDWDKSRTFLLTHGYFKGEDKKVRTLFKRSFPPTPTLAQELKGTLKNLSASDPKTRLSAAKSIARTSRLDWTDERRLWLADPRSIDCLLAGLKDPSVAARLQVIDALHWISQRYDFPDVRIRDQLVALFPDSCDEIKLAIASAIPQFGSVPVWRTIYEAFDCLPKSEMGKSIGLAVVGYSKKMKSEKLRRKFSDRFILEIADARDAAALNAILKGIAALDQKNVAAEMKRFPKRIRDELKEKQEEIRFFH